MTKDQLKQRKAELKKKYANAYWKAEFRTVNGIKLAYYHSKKIDTKDDNFILCNTFSVTNSDFISFILDDEVDIPFLQTKITKKEFDTAVSKIIAKIKEAIK